MTYEGQPTREAVDRALRMQQGTVLARAYQHMCSGVLTALNAEGDDPIAAAAFTRQAADGFATRVAELEAELGRLRTRMAEGANAAFKCPDGLHPTWMLDPQVECPWCEVERLHTWAGLMSLLDEHYPPDVVTGESGDPGPRIVALTRELAGQRQRADMAENRESALAEQLANAAAERAELERLREIVRYMTEPDAAMAREFIKRGQERDAACAEVDRLRTELAEARAGSAEWGPADELAAALTSTLAYTVTADDVREALRQAGIEGGS